MSNNINFEQETDQLYTVAEKAGRPLNTTVQNK